MTAGQEAFLRILGGALCPGAPTPEPPPDLLPEVLSLAVQQHLLPLMAERLFPAGAPAEGAMGAYRQMALGQALRQTERSVEFRALYRDLRQAGFHPVVLKGELCSALYPYAHHRTCVDNDLYLSRAELGRCHRVLLDLGLRADRPEEDLSRAGEITYRDREDRLHIELHLELFETGPRAPMDLNVFFANAWDHVTEIGDFLSLAPHDHLLYLLLHAYKHFFHSGVGLRQTCDIGLWAREYGGEIDWERLLAQCRAVRGEGFAAAQFRIAEEYLGLSLPLPGLWREIPGPPEPLLSDMLDGGLFGAESLTRLHTATITREAIRKDRTGSGPGLLGSLLPVREDMARRYPYVRDHPALLPAAWCQRLIRYARELRSSGSSSAGGSLRLAKARVELLRQYGIIRRAAK